MQFKLPSDTFKDFESQRRKVLGFSEDLRVQSKSAISSLLNGHKKEAHVHLSQARKSFQELQKYLKKNPYLYSVGGAQVGTEEYVEAILLQDYLSRKSLSTLEELQVNHESYIAGLSDMTGELLRYARKNPKRMKQILLDLERLHHACTTLIVTRNSLIRKKLEDLERNLHRMEEMVFQYHLK